MLSNQSSVMASHLPTVANFHNSADLTAAGCIYGQPASQLSQLNGVDSASGASSSQTGDALGKALASVCIYYSLLFFCSSLHFVANFTYSVSLISVVFNSYSSFHNFESNLQCKMPFSNNL